MSANAGLTAAAAARSLFVAHAFVYARHRPSASKEHVVVTGDITSGSLKEFFKEVFHTGEWRRAQLPLRRTPLPARLSCATTRQIMAANTI